MAIPAQRVKFNSIETNIATADLRSIFNNDSLNIADEMGSIFNVGSLFSFSGAIEGLNDLNNALNSITNPINAGVATIANGVNQALSVAKGAKETISNAVNQAAGLVSRVTNLGANLQNQLGQLTNISIGNLSGLTNALAGTGLLEGAISSLTLTNDPNGSNGLNPEGLGSLSRSVSSLAGMDFSKYLKPDTSNSNEASVFCNIASNTGTKGVFTALDSSPNMSTQDLNITAANIVNSSNTNTGTSQLIEVANSSVSNNVSQYTQNVGTKVLSSFKVGELPGTITEQVSRVTNAASALDNNTYRNTDGMYTTAAYGGNTGNDINNLLTNNSQGISNWSNYLQIAACANAATISEDGIARTPVRTTASNTY